MEPPNGYRRYTDSLDHDAARPPFSFDGGAEQVTAFLRSVYGWMFVGLLVTAAVAYAVASTPAVLRVMMNPFMYWGLFAVELGLVFYLSSQVEKMEPGTASGLFLLYSAINGATLSLILLVYTGASIASTFVIAGGMFGAMALYGTTTKRSLAGYGQFLFMALIGLILASIVGIFWHNSLLQTGIAVIGVLIFTALTAYDAQRLKEMALDLPRNSRTGTYAVVGALSLYLDFINIFIFLLRLLGDRRD
jgi:uncharacterized protein